MRELSFTYVGVKDIMSADCMLALGAHNIKVISTHYVLIGYVGVSKKNDCPIYEILYDDIMESKDQSIHDTYETLVERYGQEVCDLVFPKDVDFIKDKIHRTILFAMDKVYNCDKLMVTFLANDPKVPGSTSSMPQLIYEVIQENFDIIEQMQSGIKHQISIRKRKVK